MKIQARIAAVEQALERAGVSLDRFERKARIAHTTWWRWRTGKSKPSWDTWQRVERELAKLEKGDGTK